MHSISGIIEANECFSRGVFLPSPYKHRLAHIGYCLYLFRKR